MVNVKDTCLGVRDNPETVIRTKITFITFICSILVIYIHAYNLEQYGITSSVEGLEHFVYVAENFWKKIADMAVPTFFMISGLLFFRNFSIRNIFRKWKTRLFSVAIPYLLWSILYYLFFFMCANIPPVSSVMNSDWDALFSIQALLKCLWSNNYYAFWFLKNLIVYIVVAPVIWLLVNNHFRSIPTGTIGFIVLFVLVRLKGTSIPYSGGFIYYLIGAYIGLNFESMIAKNSKILSLIASAYILFMILSGIKFCNDYTIGLFIIAVWFALDLIDFTKFKVYWWMTISFFSYVTHDIILQSMKKMVWVFFPHNGTVAFLEYIFVPLMVEVFLILIAFLWKKYLPCTWKVLTGSR